MNSIEGVKGARELNAPRHRLRYTSRNLASTTYQEVWRGAFAVPSGTTCTFSDPVHLNCWIILTAIPWSKPVVDLANPKLCVYHAERETAVCGLERFTLFHNIRSSHLLTLSTDQTLRRLTFYFHRFEKFVLHLFSFTKLVANFFMHLSIIYIPGIFLSKLFKNYRISGKIVIG